MSRIGTRAIRILFGSGLFALLPLGAHLFAGNSVLVQGAISGDVANANDPADNADSASRKFETDYSGESASSAATAQKPPAVSPKIRNILKQAGILYYKGRYQEALAMLRQAEAIDPASCAVLDSKAAILSESGDIPGARKIYTKLAGANPKAFTPRYDLAELLLMEKRYDEARQAFQELLKQFPNCDLARFKILLTYLIQKKREPAGEMMAEFKQRGPSAVGYYALAATAFSTGDIAGGKKWIDAAETDFGAGGHRVLYESLADIGFVIHHEYPAKQ